MRDIAPTKFQAGYEGEDSMRNKAERMFRDEMKGYDEVKSPQSMSSKGRTNMRLYKKGGHVKHHKMEETQHDMVIPRRPKTPKLNVENFAEVEHMKRGGKIHHKSHMKKHCASGGTIYEREMLGEKTSHKRPHINYESDMKGERAEHMPTKSSRHAAGVDASHGEYMKKGGKVKKMAIGGVGKVRHEAATKRGMPISKKVNKGRYSEGR
jgi:hypothetical protein